MTVEQAFVANEILTNLIKALFDKEHGKDYFSIGELMQAAQEFQKYGKQVEDLDEDYDTVLEAIPRTTDTQVTSILESHLEKDARQFMNTTDAVLNRIRKLKERDFIWDMLSYTIEDKYWNDETNWYSKEIPMLDMKSILNSNKVVLIDTEAFAEPAAKCSPCCSSRTCGHRRSPSGRRTTTNTSRTSSSRNPQTSLATRSSTENSF